MTEMPLHNLQTSLSVTLQYSMLVIVMYIRLTKQHSTWALNSKAHKFSTKISTDLRFRLILHNFNT